MPVLGPFGNPYDFRGCRNISSDARRDLVADDLDESPSESDAAFHRGTVRLWQVLHFQQLQLGQEAGQGIIQRML